MLRLHEKKKVLLLEHVVAIDFDVDFVDVAAMVLVLLFVALEVVDGVVVIYYQQT